MNGRSILALSIFTAPVALLAGSCRDAPDRAARDEQSARTAAQLDRLEARVGRLEEDLALQRAQVEALGEQLRARGTEVAQTPQGGSRCRGLTWVVRQQQGDLVMVGSDATSDPYHGDQSCEVQLPVLCLGPAGLPQPSSLQVDAKHGWAGGEVKLTRPVAGRQLTSLQDASALCAAEHGSGYRMAEFHDGGGGWNWWARGELPTSTRFWVHINDQRANPWNTGR